jgi:hypothetical protein
VTVVLDGIPVEVVELSAGKLVEVVELELIEAKSMLDVEPKILVVLLVSSGSRVVVEDVVVVVSNIIKFVLIRRVSHKLSSRSPSALIQAPFPELPIRFCEYEGKLKMVISNKPIKMQCFLVRGFSIILIHSLSSFIDKSRKKIQWTAGSNRLKILRKLLKGLRLRFQLRRLSGSHLSMLVRLGSCLSQTYRSS